MAIYPDHYYPPSAPEMRAFGEVSTLAKWRHLNQGPAYVKLGSRVVYRGSDLLDFIEQNRVATAA